MNKREGCLNDSEAEACMLMQVLLNTAPISFTASCTSVTTTQVGQSVIPPGTTLPPNATPPSQVTEYGLDAFQSMHGIALRQLAAVSCQHEG